MIPAELVQIARKDASVELQMRAIERDAVAVREIAGVPPHRLPLLKFIARILLPKRRFQHLADEGLPVVSAGRVAERSLQARGEVIRAGERRNQRAQDRGKACTAIELAVADQFRRDRNPAPVIVGTWVKFCPPRQRDASRLTTPRDSAMKGRAPAETGITLGSFTRVDHSRPG